MGGNTSWDLDRWSCPVARGAAQAEAILDYERRRVYNENLEALVTESEAVEPTDAGLLKEAGHDAR